MAFHILEHKWMLPLCITRGVAAWGERSWDFASGILLLEYSNQNLRLTATLVFLYNITCFLLGSPIGILVERGSLLNNAVGTLGLLNLTLVAASASLLIQSSNVATTICIGFSVLAKLASMASSIVTEKQWPKALADSSVKYTPIEQEGTVVEGSSEASLVLTRINAQLKAIYLISNLLAPLAAGFILEYTSPKTCSLAIAAFNLVAWPIETACLVWISRNYNLKSEGEDNKEGGCELECVAKQESLEEFKDNKREQSNLEREQTELDGSQTQQQNEQHKSPLGVYLSQPILGSALAYALLCFTVICFGSIMSAWLVSLGFRESHVAIARALSELVGLLSTRFSLSGTIAIWLQWICLLPTAIVSPFVNQNETLLWIIVVSVILSRFGLWQFDLCVTKMLQSIDNIGTTNGVQVALQSLLECLIGLACILWPHPSQFYYLAEASFGSITTAALLHTWWWKFR